MMIDFASDKSLVVFDDDDAYSSSLFSFLFDSSKKGKDKKSFSNSAYCPQRRL